jgi:hypothetical protein
MLISPPYWGLPSESHQLPAVVALVVAVGLVVDVVTGAAVDVEVVVTAGLTDVVVTCEVVDVVQDARIRDARIKQVSAIQIIPFFISISFIIRGMLESLIKSHGVNIRIIVSYPIFHPIGILNRFLNRNPRVPCSISSVFKFVKQKSGVNSKTALYVTG